MTTVPLTCATCERPFDRSVRDHNRALVRGQDRHYCSVACNAVRRRQPPATGHCTECGNAFTRRSNGSRERAVACSSRCSAVRASRLRSEAAKIAGPKQRVCPLCGGRKHYTAGACASCTKIRHGASTTLADLRSSRGINSYHATVRGHARSSYAGPLACANCGYDLHVEVCHIRDVRDFPPTATLGEVNAQENLVALDRRCHWEFDHGHLALVGGEWVSVVPAG